MKRMKTYFIKICLFLLCLQVCVLSVFAQTPMAAYVSDGKIFIMDLAALEEVYDADESEGVMFTEAGIVLTGGQSNGKFVTKPIEMPEFSQLNLSWDCENTVPEQEEMVSVSVYRMDEERWSEWTQIPVGETAKRTKSKESTVFIRFQVELVQNGDLSPLVFKNLIVSGGEHIFTQENLIMLFIMVSALGLFVYRKKKYNISVVRKKK